ncbi:sialate O-acetylesterase [Chitinophagaceae bacterium LB-8]|uniref:Sialate O-acetylesterase n=1 Tax=Paraflavisolibacter caeni TaxID=2982496 RepID=A0A9X2Y152_9BACT|nr:sialate O-acetylesterase [Paraflavisolibacter caeni]MCU7552627.1 sialate O-acetylesterase [Paraflavisolibacter caeni]
MNRLLFFLLCTLILSNANGQIYITPTDADTVRQVSLSNLTKDRHTMIALVFGQSNAGNYGKSEYTLHNGSVFNYYGGKLYAAKDPLIGTTGTGVSVWTRVADMVIDSGLYNKVILIPIAVGGSAISRWASGDCSIKLQETLRLLDSQHIKLTHVFWHQGETDNLLNTAKETYKKTLDTILNSLHTHHQDAEMYVSIASYHPGAIAKPLGVDRVIRTAQMEFINEQKGVLLGPDTDLLIHAIHRHDGVHFSDFGLTAFARLWFKALVEKRELAKDDFQLSNK